MEQLLSAGDGVVPIEAKSPLGRLCFASIDSFLNQTAGTMLFLTYFNLLCPVEKVII
jgi:hypothetical protein